MHFKATGVVFALAAVSVQASSESHGHSHSHSLIPVPTASIIQSTHHHHGAQFGKVNTDNPEGTVEAAKRWIDSWINRDENEVEKSTPMTDGEEDGNHPNEPSWEKRGAKKPSHAVEKANPMDNGDDPSNGPSWGKRKEQVDAEYLARMEHERNLLKKRAGDGMRELSVETWKTLCMIITDRKNAGKAAPGEIAT